MISAARKTPVVQVVQRAGPAVVNIATEEAATYAAGAAGTIAVKAGQFLKEKRGLSPV